MNAWSDGEDNASVRGSQGGELKQRPAARLVISWVGAEAAFIAYLDAKNRGAEPLDGVTDFRHSQRGGGWAGCGAVQADFAGTLSFGGLQKGGQGSPVGWEDLG
jgi:hypothetical protein